MTMRFLLTGELVNSQTILAVQADGMDLLTVEGLGRSGALHPLQHAFIETGAIQKRLPIPLRKSWRRLPSSTVTLNPTELEIREAIAGVLDRETGYVKPIHAILRAAAVSGEVGCAL
jgi:aerobic-type carbon monoxide dehydrogenase small subunit (CoxS/CutS family)